ncbi:hypothetical protein PMAYCL1PPCAC_29848, partial [Pristionchus mayeri]
SLPSCGLLVFTVFVPRVFLSLRDERQSCHCCRPSGSSLPRGLPSIFPCVSRRQRWSSSVHRHKEPFPSSSS